MADVYICLEAGTVSMVARFELQETHFVFDL